jgi:hypothetical protein
LQRSARLHAQHGHFTIHGEDSRPLDAIVRKVVRKVLLPKEAWHDAWLFLADAGINESSYSLIWTASRGIFTSSIE